MMTLSKLAQSIHELVRKNEVKVENADETDDDSALKTSSGGRSRRYNYV